MDLYGIKDSQGTEFLTLTDHYVLADRSGRQLLALNNNTISFPYPVRQYAHNQLELSLVLEGTGTYLIDDRSYPILAGDVFIINNRERHKILLDKYDFLVSTVLHFEPEFLWNFSGHDPDYRFLRVFYSRNSQFSNRLDGTLERTRQIARQFLSIEEEFIGHQSYYDLKVKIIVESLLLDILRGFPYFETADDVSLAMDPLDAQRIKAVLQHIDAHIDHPLVVQELSGIAGMGPIPFAELFRRYNGVSHTKYIDRKRVERAIKLISSTDHDLPAIAKLCGYPKEEAFVEAFTKTVGFPPADYRKD